MRPSLNDMHCRVQGGVLVTKNRMVQHYRAETTIELARAAFPKSEFNAVVAFGLSPTNSKTGSEMGNLSRLENCFGHDSSCNVSFVPVPVSRLTF